MPRQLPSNRRPLRLTALGLIPVYLVLWVAGTGCYGSLYSENVKLLRCLLVLDLLVQNGISDAELVDIAWGIAFNIPPSALAVSGSSSSEGKGSLKLRQARAGMILSEIDLDVNLAAAGLISEDDLFDGFDFEPGDRLTLLLALDQAVSDLFTTVDLQENAPRVPSFRFPEAASRVKFTTAFDAEFGVPYDFGAGELIFDGSALLSGEAAAKVPKKVIVEIAHLDASGKVQSKHKQVVKINKKTGVFKTSRKAFKGFGVQAGERVRVRLKPKGGDLTGVDWTLMPTYNFVR